MSDQHDLAGSILNTVDKYLKSDANKNHILHTVYSDLAAAFKHMASYRQPPLDTDQFLTRPALLKGDAALGLINQELSTANAFTLFVTASDSGAYKLTVLNNETKKFVTPSSEEQTELLRQLHAIKADVPSLYTLVRLTGIIQGYEYHLDEPTGGPLAKVTSMGVGLDGKPSPLTAQVPDQVKLSIVRPEPEQPVVFEQPDTSGNISGPLAWNQD